MSTSLKNFIKLFYIKFMYHDIFGKSAEISYFFFISIFSLILFILALFPLLHINLTIILTFLNTYFPKEVIQPIIYYIDTLSASPNITIFSFGAILTLFSASSGINAVIKNLNKIYDKKLSRSFLEIRFISFFSTLFVFTIFSIIVIIYGFSSTLLQPFIDSNFFSLLNLLKMFFLPYFIPFIIFVVIFFLLYIPSIKEKKKKSILPGTFFCFICIYIISFLSKFYFQHFSDISYGLITSVLILLFYMFTLGFIILISALLNSTLLDIKIINDSLYPHETFNQEYLYYDTQLIKIHLFFKN